MSPEQDIEYLGVSAGSISLNSRAVQGLFAIYFGVLAGTLTKATDIRGGGFGGSVSGIVITSLIAGFLYARVATQYDKNMTRAVLSSLGVMLLFLLLISATFVIPGGFGGTPSEYSSAFIVALLLYTIAAGVVWLRLQRPVSPEDGAEMEHFGVHFDNSWKLTQLMFSLGLAGIVGIIIPLGLSHAAEFGLYMKPLGYLVAGIFSGYIVIGVQLLLELRIHELAHENSS